MAAHAESPRFTLDASALAPLVERALAAITQEYPTHVALLALGDQDFAPPRRHTPAFYGSFDWHSAVHGHWCVVRGVRWGAEGAMGTRALAALGASLTPAHLAREHEFIGIPERAGFERPYGLAWLLTLGAELREWELDEAGPWSAALAPLEQLARERLLAWARRLGRPIRSGEHGQSAFAFGLVLDALAVTHDAAARDELGRIALALYEDDRAAPLAYEPSAHDFLSPLLGEADLLRRVMSGARFAEWLGGFLPDLASPAARRWLTPVAPVDRADGKLAHFDGLNLSRAWMLDGIASKLRATDERRKELTALSVQLRAAGLESIKAEHYEGGHWLGSFAVYLVSERGLR